MGASPRNTRQKRVVWSVFEDSARPLSPSEVHSAAVTVLPNVSLATIYRIVKSLQEEHKLAAVSLPGEPARYEMKARADKHHHHFYCDRCRRVFDVPGCGLKVDAQVPKGFSIQRHEVVLYGTCNDC